MNNLTYAAISFAAPTLLFSMSTFLKVLYRDRDFKTSSFCALYAMATENLFMIPLSAYSALGYSSESTTSNDKKQYLSHAFVNIIKTSHFLISSAFTYLALTSCPLFAIPAVIVVLPLLLEQYDKFCSENSKKWSGKMLAGDSFKIIIQDAFSNFINRGLSHSAERG